MGWAGGQTCQNKPQGREAKAFLGHHHGDAGPRSQRGSVGDDAARAGLALLQLSAVQRHWENDDGVGCRVTVANDVVFLTGQV